WLAASGTASGVERVRIVLTSDDPEDLTLREARWLGRADVLLHEADVPPVILNRARADAVRRELPWDGGAPGGLVVELVRARGLAAHRRRRPPAVGTVTFFTPKLPFVIPAQAGIWLRLLESNARGPRLRGDDECWA